MKFSIFYTVFITTLFDACKAYWTLLKVIIPILSVVKLLVYIEGLTVLEALFTPILITLNLPVEAAIIFVTGLITNLYGAIVLYLSLSHEVSFTTSQVTVLAVMMLFAHSLPLELAISKKMRGNIIYLLVLRLIVAYLAGLFLNTLHQGFGLYQTPANILITIDDTTSQQTFLQAILEHIYYFLTIFVVIYALLVFRCILHQLGGYHKIIKKSESLFLFIGLKKNAVEVLMTGLLLGIIYGGTLLIQSLKNNVFSSYEILVITTFLSLMHGVVEDTLLMILIGANIFDILFIKNFIAILIVFSIVKLMRGRRTVRNNYAK